MITKRVNTQRIVKGNFTPIGIAHHKNIKNWNKSLEAAEQKFQTDHKEATVLLYSSWSFFCRVYKEPEIYGFEKSDVSAYSAIWGDHVHPSTEMHEIIGVDIGEFLSELQASSE